MRLARSRNGLIENSEAMKLRAVERRNNGHATGKSAAGHAWSRLDLDPRMWDSHVIVAQAELNATLRDAVNTYRVACLHGPGFEEADNDIPF